MTETKTPKTTPASSANFDQPTDVPHVSIRKLRGTKYLIYWNKEKYGVSIKGLADQLALKPQQVFEAMLSSDFNKGVLRPMWEEHGSDAPNDDTYPAYPGDARARVILRRRGMEQIAHYSQEGPNYTGADYISWSVPGQTNDGKHSWTALLLPFSTGFQAVLDKLEAEKQKKLTIQALKKPMDELYQQLRDLRSNTNELVRDIELISDGVKKAQQEIAILTSLDGLLGICLKFPKNPDSDPGPKDRKFAETLRQRLATLKKVATDRMVVHPVSEVIRGEVTERDQCSAKILAQLEDDKFWTNVKDALDHWDLVPLEISDDLFPMLQDAALALLRSNDANKFYDRHVVPMEQQLAHDLKIDVSQYSAEMKYPALLDAIKAAQPEPTQKSVYRLAVEYIAPAAGVATISVGNLPGPSTLAVLVFKASSTIKALRLATSTKLSFEEIGRGWRALTTASSLSDEEGLEFLLAIDRKDLGAIRKIKWGGDYMGGPKMGAAMGVANLIVLLMVIGDGSLSPAQKIAGIIQSAPATAFGGLQAARSIKALQGYLKFLDSGVYTATADTVAVIGGMIGIVLGIASMIDAMGEHDGVEIGVGAATAAGGAFSVAGFIFAAGTAADSTGVAAVVGIVLQAIGVVLMIGAAIVDYWHKHFTSGSLQTFEQMISYFGRSTTTSTDKNTGETLYDSSEYEMATFKGENADLKDAYEAVKDDEHHIWRDLWKVSKDAIPLLHDLGFSFESVATITGENETDVRHAFEKLDADAQGVRS